MKILHIRILCSLLVILASGAIIAPGASAVVKRQKQNQGFYFSGTLTYHSIEGDFDGRTRIGVLGTNEEFYIPDLDAGLGLGVAFGFKKGRGAGEVGYVRSSHDGLILKTPADAVFQAFNFDVKYHLLPNLFAQPFLTAGLCIPWLDVKNAASYNSTVDDAKFSGVGLNLGAGLALYLSPRLALVSSLGYRWITYGSVKGVTDERVDISGLNGSGLMFSAGLQLIFPARL